MSHDFETVDITLPSGISGKVRDVELRDIKKLVPDPSKTRGNPGDTVAAFLGGLWVSTEDPGPYTWQGQSVISTDGRVDWSKALQGDTAALLLDARAVTFGDDVYWRPVCANGMCQHEFKDHLDLRTLVRSGLSDEARSMLDEHGYDGLIRVKLPRSGRTVAWKLFTRGDQYRVDVVSEGDRAEVGENGMLRRLVEIEGLKDPGGRRKFVRRMSLRDTEFLREQFEEHDIWIQDTVELRCPKCGHRSEIAIPVSRDFFSLKSARPPKRVDVES